MTHKHGDFIWFELSTDDIPVAERFYGGLMGWSFKPFSDGSDYVIVEAADGRAGGMMPRPAPDAPGGWRPYIAVDDADEVAQAVQSAGGMVHVGPLDLDGVGRFALCADPQGVAFHILQPDDDWTNEAFASEPPRTGHCAWNELITTDQAGAWVFYSGLFGWTKDGEMDMGAMDKYEFIRHGERLGAIMTKPPMMPQAQWNHYFRVDDIEDAARHIRDGGGRILNEPHAVPGGEWILHGLDPEGSFLALVGPHR